MSKKPPKDEIFEGFEQSNTTPVPDIFFDKLLADLSGAEIKVLLYIIRRTAGFKKTSDAISLSQFENGIKTRDGKVLDKGCGLSRETICKALDSLEAKGYIKRHKRNGAGSNSDISLYSIRFKGDPLVVRKSDQVVRKSDQQKGSQKNRPASQKNREKVVRKSDPQETVLQQTDTIPNGIATHVADSPTDLTSLPDDLLVAELHRRELERLSTSQTELSTPVENTSPIANEPTKTVESKTTGKTPSKPKQRDTEKLNPANVQSAFEPLQKTIGDYSEIELKKFSEQQLMILLTSKQKETLANWRAIFKNAPIKLDGKLARALYDLESYDTSTETLDAIRKYCYSIDIKSERFPNGYYRTRGVKLWDVVEHYSNWQQTQELVAVGKPKVRKLTYEEMMAQPL